MRSIFLLVFIVILFYCSEKNVFKKLKQMGGGDGVVEDTDSMSKMIGASVIVFGGAAAVYFLMFDDDTNKCNSFRCPDNSIPIEGNTDKACEGGICTLSQCCACGSKYTPKGDICVAKPDKTKKCSTDMKGSCPKGTLKDTKTCTTCDQNECCKPKTCSIMKGSCPKGKSKYSDKVCTKCDQTDCCSLCKYTYEDFNRFKKNHNAFGSWVYPKEGESLTTDTYKSRLSKWKCNHYGKVIPECSKEGGKFTYTCKEPKKCSIMKGSCPKGKLKEDSDKVCTKCDQTECCKPETKCSILVEDLLKNNPRIRAKLKKGADQVSCPALMKVPRDCLKGGLGLGKLGKKLDDCRNSIPPSSKPPPPGECTKADIDHNGEINIVDFLSLQGEYGKNTPCKSGTKGCADIDGNSKVNIEDLLILLGGFGKKTPC